MRIACGQVKQIGLAYKRHPEGGADLKADPPLLQILHDSACRVQSVGAAACQQNSVDSLCRREGIQKL